MVETIIQHHGVVIFYLLDYIWGNKENIPCSKGRDGVGEGVEKRSGYYFFSTFL